MSGEDALLIPTQLDDEAVTLAVSMSNRVPENGTEGQDQTGGSNQLFNNAWGILRQHTNEGILEIMLEYRVKDGRKDTYIIGRSRNSDVPIPDRRVSSTHCAIYCDYTEPRMRVFLEDCSANGTYVNDALTKLSRGHRLELRSGDEVYLVNPRTLDQFELHYHPSVFTFINMRDRILATREIACAPTAAKTTAFAVTNVEASGEAKVEPQIEDFYIIGDKIGSGMSGEVYLCIQRKTGRRCAVKVIDTRKFSMTPGLAKEELLQEATLMHELKHPYIIEVLDTYHSPTAIYIVMELLEGGDLFDRIVERIRYTEDNARKVLFQIITAVHFLHSKRIVHRDLKPENILLVHANDDTQIKVTDFGLAKKVSAEGLRTFCGTPQYFAPEVLLRRSGSHGKGVGAYGMAADMWSVGVIMYIMLSGTFPFDEENLYDQIEQAKYSFAGNEWTHVSLEAKHMIRSLLTLRADLRLTTQQALQHPWITNTKLSRQPSLLRRSSLSRLSFVVKNSAQPPAEAAASSSAAAPAVRGGAVSLLGAVLQQAANLRSPTGPTDAVAPPAAAVSQRDGRSMTAEAAASAPTPVTMRTADMKRSASLLAAEDEGYVTPEEHERVHSVARALFLSPVATPVKSGDVAGKAQSAAPSAVTMATAAMEATATPLCVSKPQQRRTPRMTAAPVIEAPPAAEPIDAAALLAATTVEGDFKVMKNLAGTTHVAAADILRSARDAMDVAEDDIAAFRAAVTSAGASPVASGSLVDGSNGGDLDDSLVGSAKKRKRKVNFAANATTPALADDDDAVAPTAATAVDETVLAPPSHKRQRSLRDLWGTTQTSKPSTGEGLELIVIDDSSLQTPASAAPTAADAPSSSASSSSPVSTTMVVSNLKATAPPSPSSAASSSRLFQALFSPQKASPKAAATAKPHGGQATRKRSHVDVGSSSAATAAATKARKKLRTPKHSLSALFANQQLLAEQMPGPASLPSSVSPEAPPVETAEAT
eukprot:gene2831-2058_t